MFLNNKHKHKTLTLKEKCDILQSPDEGKTIRQVGEKLHGPKSTICDINKNKQKIKQFISYTYNGPDDEAMIPLQVLRHELQSDGIYDDMKSIQSMIGAMNFSNDITEKDINDWATGANEFSLDFSDEEIIQHAKRNESPVLLTDSEDDFVVMDAKTKISNAAAKKSFSVCVQWAEENNLVMQDILLLKRLEQKAQISHLNKVSQHKITLFFNKS